ncbi:MAG TPA: hypothetical protein VGB55_08135 [Tepidisphaeraceae bacterium]|jgi:hypothetical protein
MPASPPIAGDRVLLQFETFDCACVLGNVQFALAELSGVSAVDYDYDASQFWLTVATRAEPSDQVIREALKDLNVTLKTINRS